jgi:hypothetical protein
VSSVTDVGGFEAFLRETWGKAKPRPGSSIGWIKTLDMRGGIFGALPLDTLVEMEMVIQKEE